MADPDLVMLLPGGAPGDPPSSAALEWSGAGERRPGQRGCQLISTGSEVARDPPLERGKDRPDLSQQIVEWRSRQAPSSKQRLAGLGGQDGQRAVEAFRCPGLPAVSAENR